MLGGTPQPPSCPIDLDKGAFDIIRLIKLDGSNMFNINGLHGRLFICSACLPALTPYLAVIASQAKAQEGV